MFYCDDWNDFVSFLKTAVLVLLGGSLFLVIAALATILLIGGPVYFLSIVAVAVTAILVNKVSKLF